MIGEKSKELREAVGNKVACLGFKLDEKKNEGVDDVKSIIVDIGAGEADEKRILVCRTDEQVGLFFELGIPVTDYFFQV
jgi:acetate kinase